MRQFELIYVDLPGADTLDGAFLVAPVVRPVDDVSSAYAERPFALDFGLYRMPIRPHRLTQIVQRH